MEIKLNYTKNNSIFIIKSLGLINKIVICIPRRSTFAENWSIFSLYSTKQKKLDGNVCDKWYENDVFGIESTKLARPIIVTSIQLMTRQCHVGGYLASYENWMNPKFQFQHLSFDFYESFIPFRVNINCMKSRGSLCGTHFCFVDEKVPKEIIIYAKGLKKDKILVTEIIRSK